MSDTTSTTSSYTSGALAHADLDDLPVGAQLATAAVAATVAARPASPTDDPDHATRQEAARRACEAIGITWPETILPPGTALYDSGVETLRADRSKWARLPIAADALPVVSAALAAEDRRDYRLPVAGLRLHDRTGRVVREVADAAAPGLGYTAHAFRQLLGQVPGLRAGDAPRGTAGVLLALDGDERAAIVNRRIGRADKGATVTLRTKLAHAGGRVLRAVLSERYADVGDLDVAVALSGALNGDARTAKLDYRPGDAHSQFEVLYPSEIPIPLFRVGDVHKAIVLLDNSETGQGSIRVRAGVVRARCANLTLATGFGVEVRLVHSGNSDRVRGQLKAAIGQAAAQIAPLVDTIQHAATVEVPAGKSPGDLFAAIARRFDVAVPTVKGWREVYEARYLPAYGANLWSVTSAITEASQGAGSWWEQQGQDEVAAELLHKQWVVLNERRA